LLVALFIVLFASSSIDIQKFQAISNAFNAELTGGSGMFDYPSPIPQGTQGSSDEQEEEKETQEENNDNEENVSGLGEKEQERLAEIQKNINAYVQENGLSDQLTTSLTYEGLSLTIRDNILFEIGSADVHPDNIVVAQELSKLLEMDVPRSIIIIGHTDNIPIHNSDYASNWELSVMRAINFMKVLLENQNLQHELFTAKALASSNRLRPMKQKKEERKIDVLKC
jgi:chemotaxis protein MotB